jgi:hypothetical protein
MMVLTATMFVAVGLTAVAAVGDVTLTAARARAAADAAALAAVGTSPLVSGGRSSPRVAAEQTAHANDAEVVAVDAQGWPLRYGVTVTVQPALAWVAAITSGQQARSVAAVRPIRVDQPRPGV